MNNALLKLGGLVIVGYVSPLILSFVLTVIVAGATEHWGAARAGRAMMLLFLSIVFLFSLSTGVVGWGAWRLLNGIGARIVVIAGFLAVVAPTVLLIGFLLAVVFNR